MITPCTTSGPNRASSPSPTPIQSDPSQVPGLWELLQRCLQDGGEDDWRAFVHRCRRGLRGFLGAHLDPRVRDATAIEVEDLLQELQMRLLGLENRLVGASDRVLWAYLRRAAVRLVADQRRRATTLKRAGYLLGRDPGLEIHEVAATQPGPEERLLAVEGWERFVDDCVTCFPRPRRPLVRQIVRLVWVEGCNSRETAQRLGDGMAPQDVDNLVVRLRRKLALRGVVLPRRRGGRERSKRALPTAAIPAPAW